MTEDRRPRPHRKRASEVEDWSKPKAPTHPRACICCGVQFRSEGAHHRMCKSCRTGAWDRNPAFPGAVIE
ncbi:hypothetical protein [Albimonas pacifica]|uniref:Uncharacterized protein n=1 Tax=Albimonas pacifica TaxID=1114924 RepID=A0A1I3JIT5_9RHOB|nr:hypothetical protein [Albimonas pacifica]SFI60161.1 hypothetical protein SAMN05216258_10826 [Albimonas pacifica]